MHEIWKIFWPKVFFWSIMNMPLRKNIHNLPQGPPNPGLMQEKVQKGDFLKKPSWQLKFFCCFRFLWISRRLGKLNWKRLVFLLSKILYKKCGIHILKYGNDSAFLHSSIIDTFQTTIHLIKGRFSKMSILSLCAYWLALLSKKLHFCIFRLWKKSGAIFASFDGLCGCQDDRNPRVHLLFPCERGRSMTLSYPQGAWNILASQAGVVGVLLLLQQCSTVQYKQDHRGFQPFCVS